MRFTEDPKSVLRKLHQQKHFQLELKGTETVQNEKRILGPPTPIILVGSRLRDAQGKHTSSFFFFFF